MSEQEAFAINIRLDPADDAGGSIVADLTMRAWLGEDAAVHRRFRIADAPGDSRPSDAVTVEVPSGPDLLSATAALVTSVLLWARRIGPADARLCIIRPDGDRLEIGTPRIRAIAATALPTLATETANWAAAGLRIDPKPVGQPEAVAPTDRPEAVSSASDAGSAGAGEEVKPGRPWLRKLLSAPGIVLAAAATTLVSFVVTEVATRVNAEVRAEDPLDVSVERDPARIPGMSSAGVSAVIPAGTHIKGGLGDKDCDGFQPFVRANNGVDTERSQLQVVLQGKVPDAVLITSMRAVILDRRPPLTGIAVACPTEGEAAIRSVTVDLDAAPPKVTYAGSRGKPFAFTVANGETETFNVTAHAEKAYYRWVLEVDVVVGGIRKTIRVGDLRDPFATSAVAGRAYWSYEHNGTWGASWWGDNRPTGLPANLTVRDGQQLPPLP